MTLNTLKQIDSHLSAARKLIETLHSDDLQISFIDDNSPMLATIQENLKVAISDNICPWPKTANQSGDRYEFIPTSKVSTWGRYEVLHFDDAYRDWRDLVYRGEPFQMNVISDEAFLFNPARRDSRLFNCWNDHSEPDWNLFSNLELGGCVQENGRTTGGIERDKAHFFTVYGRLKDGGADAITDIPIGFNTALKVANELARIAGMKLSIVC